MKRTKVVYGLLTVVTVGMLIGALLQLAFIHRLEKASDSHTAEYIASLVDKSIEEVGPENVVQVVTDNASANMAACRILRTKYPQIFWSSCAAHYIDLMLEEIGKESKVKIAITKAMTLTVFIYIHAKTLSLMRQFTQKGEIVRPRTTRFATTYLTLQSVMEKKDKLRLMFSSDEWRACKWYRTKKGEMTSAIVLSPSFWTQVSLTLKVFSPLVHVLRIVDGDRRPAMGFIYGELQDARKEIMSIFKDVEASYKHFIDAIDSKSKGILDSPLHLAAYFLNPYFFYRDNAQIQREGLALKGFLDCMDIFYHDLEIQDINTRKELPLYEGTEGSFGKPLAIRQRSIIDDDFNPAGGLPLQENDREATNLRLEFVKPEIVSWSPRIIIFHNFLSMEECDNLRALAQPRLADSTVVDSKTGKGVKSSVRTSSGMFLTPEERKYPIIEVIENRIAFFSQIPKENGELIQVLRYEKGQYYKPHHDYFSDSFNVKRGGQRIATMLMYLNDKVEGGETLFPMAGAGNCSCGGQMARGICVNPAKGDAVLFWSQGLDGKEDPRSVHGGCAVISGEKWSATKWMRQRRIS